MTSDPTEARTEGPTPFEFVCQSYLPPERVGPNVFDPHPLQVGAINRRALCPNAGLWLDMGTGKTFVATWLALFHLLTKGYPGVVIMPPVLIAQWARWLRSLRPQPGAAPITVTEYRGTPAQRAQLSLHATFVLVGIQIFKRDYQKFVAAFSGRGFTLIVDEATTIANINTDNHEKVFDFSVGLPQIMLTGTPADPPSNAYALLKFSAPGSYRNLKHFRNTHIDEVDLYKKVLAWKGLDDLAEKMKVNSERILFSDMYRADQEPLLSQVEYDLEPDHHRLYKKLADEQLLLLPDGGKIDATTVQRLTHALGQIIVNQGHFSGNAADEASIFDYLDLKLEGLGSGKLVVYAHYQMTVQRVVERYAKLGAVGYNGAVTDRQKEKNKQRFIEDPNCRVFVLQYASGGLGLDGLQWVCNHGVMIEPCRQAYVFRQSIARLKRGGQKYRVMIDIMTAKKTLQVRAFKDLLNNDDVACRIIPNKTELRKLIYGEQG